MLDALRKRRLARAEERLRAQGVLGPGEHIDPNSRAVWFDKDTNSMNVHGSLRNPIYRSVATNEQISLRETLTEPMPAEEHRAAAEVNRESAAAGVAELRQDLRNTTDVLLGRRPSGGPVLEVVTYPVRTAITAAFAVGDWLDARSHDKSAGDD